MASGVFSQRKSNQKLVVDGSEIEKLVEDKEAFSIFVDHKFEELDRDRDGKLSVRELQPAVADIGAALGLPAVGSSPESDHIYAEVLTEFTHGKKQEVSKIEFKKVMSDILLGVAAGLKRDPIVILRIDGKDLREFVESSRFETEAVTIFSGFESSEATLRKCLIAGLGHITAANGMPPAYDSWVSGNVVEPTLHTLPMDALERSASQEDFLGNFKKLLWGIVQRLEEKPVIVAHSENTFNGSGIRRLLANKFEFDKLFLDFWRDLPKNRHQKIPTEFLRIVLDKMAASAELPPYGAVSQVDDVVNEAIKMVKGGEGGEVAGEVEMNKLLREVLGSIMLQLEGNPIFVSTNSVVHETLVDCTQSTSLLPPTQHPLTS